MLNPSVPAWFEIPAADLDRATRFYEDVLGARLTRGEMGPMTMAVFPFEKPHPSGALVRAEGYEPNARGTVVYLHLDDIRPAIAKVPSAGGGIVLPLTRLPDEAGVFAQIRDCEGNRVGLYSRA